jgi:PPOX class probable F420-dependent enzyme
MDAEVMRGRLEAARVGRLATVTPAGAPHVVPCCFAVVGDTAYSAVDAKPKSTFALRRLTNVRARPLASLLVDHYAEDWTTLWWIRVDGRARVIETGPERTAALRALQAKYDQYREVPPPGPVLAVGIEAWRGWSYDDPRPPARSSP